MVNQTKPRCAGATTRRVGSVTMAASARMPRASTSRVPIELHSSSATAVTITGPWSCPDAWARAAAAHIDATPPFMSQAPRPQTLPSSKVPLNGSCVIPSTCTVSMWPFSSSDRPGPEPMRATTLARGGVSSITSASKPQPASTSRSARAHAASPGPSLASDGLRESMRTSSRVSSTGSNRDTPGTYRGCRHARGARPEGEKEIGAQTRSISCQDPALGTTGVSRRRTPASFCCRRYFFLAGTFFAAGFATCAAFLATGAFFGAAALAGAAGFFAAGGAACGAAWAAACDGACGAGWCAGAGAAACAGACPEVIAGEGRANGDTVFGSSFAPALTPVGDRLASRRRTRCHG